MLTKLLTLIFCLLPLTCFAQDYYVYIRTYDRWGVTNELTAGRSKKGDIVDVRLANYTLSKAETSEYAIIKVSNLTTDEIRDFKEVWYKEDEQCKAYRRRKIDFNSLGVVNTGLYAITFSANTIKSKVASKTAVDITYYKAATRLYVVGEPFRKFYRKRVEPYAYAAETISTINRTGQTYDTLTIWEDTKDGDITAGNAEVAECYDDDGDLDDQLLFAGWTTDADSYVKVVAPTVASVGGTDERHSGTASSGFKIVNTTTAGDAISTNNTNLDCYIEGLVIDCNMSTGATSSAIETYNASGQDLYISYNVIYISSSGTGDTPRGLNLWSNTGTYQIWNNIIYDIIESGANTGRGIYVRYGTSTASNNTIMDCDGGGIVEYSNGVSNINNNICNGNGTDYAGSHTSNGYNVAEDTSSPDAAYDSYAVTFDNEGADDFTVDDSAHDATLDDGEDLAGTFTDDIEGVTRTPWYIGASEGPAAAVGRRMFRVGHLPKPVTIK